MENWQINAIVNILAVIAESGDTQSRFAEKAKINRNHLNPVLKGHRALTRQLVAKIAAYTKRPSSWFYADHSGTTPKRPGAKLLAVKESSVPYEPDEDFALLDLLNKDADEGLREDYANATKEITELRAEIARLKSGFSGKDPFEKMCLSYPDANILDQLISLYFLTGDEYYRQEWNRKAREILKAKRPAGVSLHLLKTSLKR